MGDEANKRIKAAVADFFGEGYHALGPWMAECHPGSAGKARVLRVMRDPGRFLTVYNLCAASWISRFRFDPSLAKGIGTPPQITESPFGSVMWGGRE